ncbi:uncharacterized protein LOC123509915 [Portunus trituberculatus]|uniref:uncharacterized protein LOC123509915 n=1 Tax=Portunus trituberculatus TaxID=210409 RepID=UPI001E1CD5BF|nr:uncharacterized protein LOC123509915 [Portunus trituberculatus]
MTDVQLHHFSDASQHAYGVVSYLRMTNAEGAHQISFVCGKAKLALLKQQTIPRLELCAAVLATRADKQSHTFRSPYFSKCRLFISALTRFTGRRGTPKRIHSDNGTNMLGATHEPKEPGGVWEHQIRTVRKVLQAVVGSQTLDDERLHTLFCAVEEIVNGRPITLVSDDPNDLIALTPLQLLRMGADFLPVGNDLTVADTYCRRWKHAQYIADQFWKRWLKEYLPTLRQRRGPLRTQGDWHPGDIVLITDQLPTSKSMDAWQNTRSDTKGPFIKH